MAAQVEQNTRVKALSSLVVAVVVAHAAKEDAVEITVDYQTVVCPIEIAVEGWTPGVVADIECGYFVNGVVVMTSNDIDYSTIHKARLSLPNLWFPPFNFQFLHFYSVDYVVSLGLNLCNLDLAHLLGIETRQHFASVVIELEQSAVA